MSRLRRSERLFEFRQSLEDIGDEAVVGDLEDRDFLVLVDRDDDLGILQPARCWMAPYTNVKTFSLPWQTPVF